ncbi:hypothetical protein IAI18_08080 [Acetobacteraceae bacterium H6797]|nr:hypothetical protein [Acetobacteraceae bacterium H6797]
MKKAPAGPVRRRMMVAPVVPVAAMTRRGRRRPVVMRIGRGMRLRFRRDQGDRRGDRGGEETQEKTSAFHSILRPILTKAASRLPLFYGTGEMGAGCEENATLPRRHVSKRADLDHSRF